MDTTSTVVKRLWALCNFLRNDGITYHEYITELTYLLFLKLATELDVNKRIPSQYRWDSLASLPPDDGLERYREALASLSGSADPLIGTIFAGSVSRISRPDSFFKLIDGINSINWYRSRQNGLGDIYEGLIEKSAAESRLGTGQYFTPRVLVEALVSVIKPQQEELVYDPAAGTGGFLVAAGLYPHNSGRDRSPTLLGRELVHDVQRLALMNLHLHGLEGTIEVKDAFATHPEDVGADVCITNPPFGIKGALTSEQLDMLDYPTHNKQLAFLQHIYRSLRAGGRAAVVVPDNVLFELGVARNVRTHLLDNYNLHTILRLPPGIFYATGVKTSVLFFEKTGPTERVWIYDVRAALSGDTKKRKITHADLAPFVAAMNSDSREQRTTPHSRYVSRGELADLEDRLDLDAADAILGGEVSPIELLATLTSELELALASSREMLVLLTELTEEDHV